MFIVDTNILMSDYKNIELLNGNIMIPMTVIEELDNHKNDNGSGGYNARKSLKIISDAVDNDDLLENGFNLFVDECTYSEIEKNDHKIIASVHSKNGILVTNDVAMKVRAVSSGVTVKMMNNDSNNDGVLKPGKVDRITIDYNLLQEIFNNGKIKNSDINKGYNFHNSCFMVSDENKTGSALLRRIGDNLVKITQPKNVFEKITGKNIEQRLYLDMLLDPKIRVILVNGVAGCVDKDTEYFNGIKWKSIDSYVDGDKVLQYHKDGSATLAEPQEYHKYDAEHLCRFKTKYGLDQCLSDEHNVVYETSRGNLAKKKFSEVRTMHENSKVGFRGKFFTSFKYSGNGIDLSDNEIKIMLSVIGDSYFPPNNTNRCAIRLKKDRKKKELKILLTDGGYDYSETDVKPEGFTRFSFEAPRKEKDFESYWYNCSQEQLQLVCDNVLKWDGSVVGNRKSFSTTSKKSADFIQFAFSACGYRATICINDRVGENFKATLKGDAYKRKSVEYDISITNRTMVGMTRRADLGKEKVVFENYKTIDGKKYCFTTDTGMLILRRNNKIFITGNSGKTLLALAAACQLRKSGKFSEIICAKSVEEVGAKIGFRPGEEESKIGPYYAAFNDNLEYLAMAKSGNGRLTSVIPEVQYEHFGYMRGRTFRNSFLLYDECQNLSNGELKTAISRAGSGSKVVCCGDLHQIDNNQSKYANGLFHAQKRLIGNEIVGVITLEKSERSKISKLCSLL